jgi:hypothetical protein
VTLLSCAVLARKKSTESASRSQAIANSSGTGLRIGEANDQFERDADRAADDIMQGRQLQRYWSISNIGMRSGVQRKETTARAPACAPPVVHEVLNSAGQPLSKGARDFFEPRFGHNFSGVRLHTGAKAAESARAVGALAYTVGQNIVLPHSLDSRDGQALLAHELTHTVQQHAHSGPHSASTVPSSVGGPDGAERQASRTADLLARGQRATQSSWHAVAPGSLQKAEKLGTPVKNPAGAKGPFKKAEATFDGEDFELKGDGRPLVQAKGQSGRPLTVRASDAKACGGSPDDSYMNNPRYVGIADNGPIPEGQYTFRLTDMTTFSSSEQLKMSLAGESEYVDPAGLALHGDWGAARAPLRPVKLVASKFCGSTASRSGFYLHGGVMPGSSGCIDVGNDAITKVVSSLTGFTPAVSLTVKYTHSAPDVGALQRAAGRFMYPSMKNPDILDRVKSVFGGTDQ